MRKRLPKCAVATCGEPARSHSRVLCGWHWCCLSEPKRVELNTKFATGYWRTYRAEYEAFLASVLVELQQAEMALGIKKAASSV